MRAMRALLLGQVTPKQLMQSTEKFVAYDSLHQFYPSDYKP